MRDFNFNFNFKNASGLIIKKLLLTNLAEKAGKPGCAVASEAVETTRINVRNIVACGSVLAQKSAVSAQNWTAFVNIK
jgi:hypothetical protein